MARRTQSKPRRTRQEVPRFSKPARAARRRQGLPFWASESQGLPFWSQPTRGGRGGIPAGVMSERDARRFAEQFAARLTDAMGQQAAGAPVIRGRVDYGSEVVRRKPVAPPQPRLRTWRFRRHVQPFAWLAALIAAGAGLGHVPHHPLWWGLAAGVLVPLGMVSVAGQRRKDCTQVFSGWVRRFTRWQALATSVWLPVMAAYGIRPAAPWVLVSCAPFLALWVRHYRWVQGKVEVPPAAPAGPSDDTRTWAALAGQQKWKAILGPAEPLDGGGRRFKVQCDGVKTVIKDIVGKPDNVAGAWHRPVTECFAERDPQGVASRGYLTILGSSTLQDTRWWDGRGMDKRTGLVRIGRFADGQTAHTKWYTPRYGTRHDLFSGTTGCGKTELLNLYVFAALLTGWFVPVICDPQEGQSLPFWQDRCLYASGVGQVERRIRGLHAGFLDRSSVLGRTPWNDDGVRMPGMPFFDYELLGGRWPMVLVIIDEAHMVLRDGDKQQRQIVAYVLEMARLIRKAGGKMVLATQVPGLEDLGGKQALRDMLRGGNVWSGRTANKVASGMLGLAKDPSEIPRFFGDQTETAGLSYTAGPDNRPDAPMRTDRIPKELYRNPPPVPVLDDRFLEVMDRAMREAVSPSSTVAPVTGAPAPAGAVPAPRRPLFGARHLTAVPDLDPEDAPAGRRCADAVLRVLTADGGPLERGVIIERAGLVSKEWGRRSPWTIKAVGNALQAMTASGTIVQPAGKGTAYRIR
jgi:hypothetical protein